MLYTWVSLITGLEYGLEWNGMDWNNTEERNNKICIFFYSSIALQDATFHRVMGC